MKYYHMIIEKKTTKPNEPKERKEYISTTQGAAPAGWKCIGVCGYHEKPGHK
jgi:hypothetical protein